MKRIGVLTSGGDAPGMNASVRAAVRYAIYKGIEAFGVERGYEGLVNDVMTPLSRRSVSDILQRGGTVLKTARVQDFHKHEVMEKAALNLKRRGIEGLIVIGGDGSFRGARDLYNFFGVKTVGIPGTIDNDLAYTDYTLGFDTAVNTVLSAVNNLRDTMTSHDRVCVIEVMGRKSGAIALYSAIGGGAEGIIVPELNFDAEELCSEIRLNYEKGKTSDIIVLAEGVMKASELKAIIKEKTGVPVRDVVLGYIQRGGSPTLQDRILGAEFGVRAVELLLNGEGCRAVGIRDNKIIDCNINDALEMKREFNIELYKTAKILSL